MQPSLAKRPATRGKVPHLLREVINNRWAYLFLLPKAILFIVFLVIPVVWSVLLAFQKYNVLIPSKWIGLENFRQIFESPVYPIALWNTLKYTVVSVPAGILIALAVSSLIFPLSQKAQTFFRPPSTCRESPPRSSSR